MASKCASASPETAHHVVQRGWPSLGSRVIRSDPSACPLFAWLSCDDFTLLVHPPHASFLGIDVHSYLSLSPVKDSMTLGFCPSCQ